MEFASPRGLATAAEERGRVEGTGDDPAIADQVGNQTNVIKINNATDLVMASKILKANRLGNRLLTRVFSAFIA